MRDNVMIKAWDGTRVASAGRAVEVDRRRGKALNQAVPCAASTALFENVEVLPRLEAYGLAGRDRDFGACARISSHPGLPGLDRKNTEPAQFDAIAFRQGLFHRFEDGVDRCLGFGAYKPCPFNDTLDKILFDQRGTFQNMVLGCPTGTRK